MNCKRHTCINPQHLSIYNFCNKFYFKGGPSEQIHVCQENGAATEFRRTANRHNVSAPDAPLLQSRGPTDGGLLPL